MKISKEVRQRVEVCLSVPWGRITLKCDTDTVSLSVVQRSALRFEIMMHVNGWFRGVWMDAKKPVPEQKYLRMITKSLVRPAERKRAEKELGKRYVAKSDLFNASYSYYLPHWPSAKAVLAHLSKIASSIEIVDDEAFASHVTVTSAGMGDVTETCDEGRMEAEDECAFADVRSMSTDVFESAPVELSGMGG